MQNGRSSAKLEVTSCEQLAEAPPRLIRRAGTRSDDPGTADPASVRRSPARLPPGPQACRSGGTERSSASSGRPSSMERILVSGSTGAGKSTLARAIARRRAIPFHEMDTLAFAGPGWQENENLAEDVSRISSGPCWIFDSLGYPPVRDMLWSRADTIVWLDYSRGVVMRRVLRRSAARTLLRRRIFGGNVETLASLFSSDHPAWWAWTQFHRAQGRDRLPVRQRSIRPAGHHPPRYP